jgi:hypothetical protein
MTNTAGQRALSDIVMLIDILNVDSPSIVQGWVRKVWSELDVATDLLAALEVLVKRPSDDWRDATEDADGHLRTPLSRAESQAYAAIAKATKGQGKCPLMS